MVELMDVALKGWRVSSRMFGVLGMYTSHMNRLGTASGAGAFHRQSLYTSQNTWNTFLPIRHMRRRHSRIPTGALRTVTWAVMAGAGSALGKDGSHGSGILVTSEAPGGTTGSDSQLFGGQRITLAASTGWGTDTGDSNWV